MSALKKEKNSPNKNVRKEATFAKTARKWKTLIWKIFYNY